MSGAESGDHSGLWTKSPFYQTPVYSLHHLWLLEARACPHTREGVSAVTERRMCTHSRTHAYTLTDTPRHIHVLCTHTGTVML